MLEQISSADRRWAMNIDWIECTRCGQHWPTRAVRPLDADRHAECGGALADCEYPRTCRALHQLLVAVDRGQNCDTAGNRTV